MLSIEIVSKTGGIPSKRGVRDEQARQQAYKLGRESAMVEVEKSAIDVQKKIADMYSALVMAQTKNILNSVLTDVARVLAQVKMNNVMLTQYLQNLTNGAFQPPPPLTPTVPTPNPFGEGLPPIDANLQQLGLGGNMPAGEGAPGPMPGGGGAPPMGGGMPGGGMPGGGMPGPPGGMPPM